MEFSVLISTVVLMAILISSGIILSRFVEPTLDVRQFLMTLIINVALPSIILHGIFQLEVNSDLFKQVVLVFACAALISIIGILLSYGIATLFKYTKDKEPEIAFLGGLGNTGIVGIPICTALFGAKGALFSAVFDTGMCITLWTLGVYLLNRHNGFSWSTVKSVLTPPLFTAIGGLVLAALNIRPTGIIYNVIESFAQLTAPLSMMYVGMLIYIMFAKRNFETARLVTIPLVVKLVLVPALAMVLLSLMTMDETIKMIILIQATMPSLTTASIIMARYKRDENFAALTTLISIILSLLTIPGILLIGRSLLF
jgi:hypothetical protein